MNNKALERAKELIEFNFGEYANFDLNKPIEAHLGDNYLKDDPNLEVLKSELNKIGFTITPAESKNWYTITKIKN